MNKETKDYVTTISELGRKRYKDEMIRFNASQKIIQLKKEHADMTADTDKKTSEKLKKQPTATKTVQVGSPVRRDTASLKAKPMPVTPDRTISNLRTVVRKPSPSVVTPHRYPHPPHHGLPMMMYPHRYGIAQLPTPLPPPMPTPMSSPSNMPPLYQHRPRQFQCPVKTAKKNSALKVEKDAIVTSSREAMSHEALHISSALMDHEFMNFEPDHITEDIFEEDNTAAPKNVEDEDILDMIKGDVWNMNIDNFNFDEDPFSFLAD